MFTHSQQNVSNMAGPCEIKLANLITFKLHTILGTMGFRFIGYGWFSMFVMLLVLASAVATLKFDHL